MRAAMGKAEIHPHCPARMPAPLTHCLFTSSHICRSGILLPDDWKHNRVSHAVLLLSVVLEFLPCIVCGLFRGLYWMCVHNHTYRDFSDHTGKIAFRCPTQVEVVVQTVRPEPCPATATFMQTRLFCPVSKIGNVGPLFPANPAPYSSAGQLSCTPASSKPPPPTYSRFLCHPTMSRGQY